MSGGTSSTEHDTILQTLDRESKGVFLSKEFFEPSVEDWNQVPLIFADDHPNPDAYDQDPNKELARIKGRLIDGSASGTHIDPTGHPRLMTVLQLRDKEIEKGIADGKISISTGMRATTDGKKVVQPVRPHHILFFEETRTSQPGDKGAFILNTENDDDRLIERFKAFLKGSRGKGEPSTLEHKEEKSMTDNEVAGKLAIAESKLAERNLAFTDLETRFKGLEDQMKAKDAAISELKAANEAYVKKEKDLAWQVMKDKHVPAGMVKDAASEATVRQMFETAPMQFMDKVLTFKAENPTKADDGAEPLNFMSGRGKTKAKSFEDKLAEAGVTAIHFSGPGED